MKKLRSVLAPFFAIIFGALLLLYYLNFLQYQNTTLAVGIIAVVFACFYLAYGVLSVVLGSKLPQRLKDYLGLASVVLFPLFIFLEVLLALVSYGQNEMLNLVGPTGWFIAITSMAGSLCFAILYVVAFFTKIAIVDRLTYLFGFIFMLVLLLNILFGFNGNAIALGEIDVIQLVISIAFSSMLLRTITSIESNGGEQASEEPSEEEQA